MQVSARKFAGLCELQKKNGVQFGEQYKNDKGCKTFISYIAQVEKGKIQSAVSDSRFMSILSDGSTDSGIVEQEAVYIRYVNKKGRMQFQWCISDAWLKNGSCNSTK